MSRTNRMWTLRQRPLADVTPGDLALIEAPVPDLAEGEVLVRNLYLSLDPTHRLWMSGREQYMPPVGVGDVMRGGTIGVVEQSRSPEFREGDLVVPPMGGWQLYSIARADACRRVREVPGVPLTAHISVLGGTGVTAYFGLTDIGHPKAGETLVVSAAAGAVGSVAGQIGRIMGLRVVGIAGGREKCDWITRELGFDGAIDYKGEDVGQGLDRLCPSGVDIDFENVGGAVMDAVFSRLNRFGRMLVCGMISRYNDEGPMPGPTDFGSVLMKRLTIRGFLLGDYLDRRQEAVDALAGWIAEGRIKWREHIVEGIDAAPEALGRLFTGDHQGKLLVRLSD